MYSSFFKKLIPGRFRWQIRRLSLMRSILGFWAHVESYANDDCLFSPYNHLYMKTWLVGSRLGRYTYLAHGARCGFAVIGSFCSIGPESIIGGLGKHPITFLSTHPAFFSTKKQAGNTFVTENLFDEVQQTSIGNDVWVGARAMILDGIAVGDGAIVAAGSIVTRDVPPYAVVAGVPAKIIKYRFDNQTIAKLLEKKWWNLTDESIKELALSFTQNDFQVANILG